MDDPPDSGSSTPATSRFTSQGYTAEDLLKQQTVGLVQLSDFRKRRAEAIEQTERGSRDGTPTHSGAVTPHGRELASKPDIASKKRKKAVKRGGLSFGDDEEEENGNSEAQEKTSSKLTKTTAGDEIASAATTDSEALSDQSSSFVKKNLKPNSSLSFQPKAMTKAAVLRDAQLKEQLRKEYTLLQEAIKATEFCLPFVFFDGKNAPGGMCRMKKGDFIWLFLERARKVGAGTGAKSRRDWARIGVDDLMVVRGDLIIPHHYDFHYFIINRSVGYKNNTVFPLAGEPTAATPKDLLSEVVISETAPASETDSRNANKSNPSTPSNHLQTASQRAAAAAAAAQSAIPDAELEGYNDDPSLTKVVDRRWYEKNKHIYPASVWEEFDATKDYSKGAHTDGLGNAFFFGR